MFRNILLGIAVLGAGVSAAPIDQVSAIAASSRQTAASTPSYAPGSIEYKVVTRVPESHRRAVFGELAACRAVVNQKADEQYPEVRLQSPGYSPKADVRRFRERARFQDAGSAECARQALKTHTLEPRELTAMLLEGVIKKWEVRPSSSTR